LIRFYVLHVLFLPAILGVLFVYHMWRVRKDGGLASADRAAREARRVETPPSKTKTYTLLGVARGTAPRIRAATVESGEETVNSVPDLARRAAIVVLGTIALVGILSVFVRSPLEEPANPIITPNPAKAPWYFLWLQEIVTDTTLHIGRITINGAFIGGVLVPGILLALLTAWPWLDRSPAAAAAVWFAKSRRRQNVVFLAILLAVLLLTIVGTFLRGPYWNFYWPWQPWPELPSRI
jgi:cytochrome b-561